MSDKRNIVGKGAVHSHLSSPLYNVAGIKFTNPAPDSVDDLSSSESEDDNKREVNLQYSTSEKKQTNKTAKSTEKEYDATWLRQEIGKYFGSGTTELGLSVDDLTTTVFDVLTSSKPDSELQNEVCII